MDIKDLIEALELVQAQKARGGGQAQQLPSYNGQVLFNTHAVPVQQGYKHTTPSGTVSQPYYTGPGGLFGVSQLPEQDVLSTRIAPAGLVSMLPWKPTRKFYPLFPYLTGFLADTGSNPSGVCDDAKVAGSGKSAYMTAIMGRYERMTREMEINRVGVQIDRGDSFDYRLVNDPLGRDAELINALAQSSLFRGLPPADSLVNGRETLARMIEVGISFQQLLTTQTWIGNPDNNRPIGADPLNQGYREFPGLEILIGTNKVDALTGTDVPSLDSNVRNANYAKVDSTTFDIVSELANMARQAKSNASRMGYNPVKWIWAMRESLFYELTKVWPCRYITSACTTGNTTRMTDVGDEIAMRDAMRNERFLLIDGQRWDVVFDDGIVEESSANTSSISTTCFASDIYLIPLTVRGNFAVTYFEYLDYSPPGGAMQAAMDGNYSGDFFTDGGIFLWHNKPPKNWCIQLIAKIEPRLIFRAPFLAARLNNVQYCPIQHTRDPFNADPYFVNGGVSTPRAAPSYQTDWSIA